MPSACLGKTSYKEKMRGFYGFRAKMVIRVQLNGQRFQQGRLLLHYLPEANELQGERKYTALSHLTLITQMPRMDIDVAHDTEVIMEIPYVSTDLYSSLISDTNDYGTFYLTPYTALRVGTGASSVQLSIWCHFEDVEIVYPTVPGLVTQSGIRRKTARGGGSTGGVDITDSELNQSGLGPISGLASRVSNAASILSEIPLISAFTAPVAWASGIVSRSALALGYSKPSYEGAFSRGVPTLFPNAHNVDGIDNSAKMSLTSNNKLEQLPGFAGTDVDEMAFASLVQIPSYYQTLNWSTSAAYGTQLGAFPIGPGYFANSVPYATNTGTMSVQYFPVFGYLSNLFRYWRGSIKFTFKVAKTEFHSGRLLFAFMPGKNRIVTDAVIADSQYLFKEVYDLRTSSEICVTVPFVSLTPYLSNGDWSGVAYLWVLNPLVAPDTVTPAVDIIVEVSAGEDFEYSVPRWWGGTSSDQPRVPCLIGQSGLKPFRVQGLVPQGMDPKLPVSSGVHECSDSDSVTQKDALITLEPAKFCIGERILSIRQLLKSSTVIWSYSGAVISGVIVQPWVTAIPVFKVGTAYAPSSTCIDYYSYFVNMYRYYRGAARIKVATGNTSGTFMASMVPATGNVTAAAAIGTATDIISGVQTIIAPSLSSGTMGMQPEVEMPFYGNTHCRQVYNASNYSPLALESSKCGHSLIVQMSGSSGVWRVLRSAGDDFSAGFFIGTLPLL
jgi:hypothetical protein